MYLCVYVIRFTELEILNPEGKTEYFFVRCNVFLNVLYLFYVCIIILIYVSIYFQTEIREYNWTQDMTREIFPVFLKYFMQRDTIRALFSILVTYV